MHWIRNWSYTSLYSCYRFLYWYPSLFVGVCVLSIAFFLFEPSETLLIFSPFKYVCALITFFIPCTIFIRFLYKKKKGESLLPHQQVFFQTSLIAIICCGYIAYPKIKNFSPQRRVTGELYNYRLLQNNRIRAIVHNRTLIDFYGKPVWSLVVFIDTIHINEISNSSFEPLLSKRSYQIRAPVPCPVTSGSFFEVDADIKIVEQKEGVFHCSIKPKWESSLIIIGRDKWYEYIGELRLYMSALLQNLSFQLYSQDEKIRNLLLSLLFGFPLEKDIQSDIHRVGVDHLFTVSGFHFNSISGCVALVLFTCSLQFRAFASIIVSSLFLFIVGIQQPSPSILRSWWTIVLASMGILFGKQIPPLHLLGIGLTFVTLCDPSFPFSTGFQLSFLATWGILLYYEPIASFFSEKIFCIRSRIEIEEMNWYNQCFYLILRLFSSSFSLSLSVWLFIIPYCFSFLDGFTPLGFIYNVLLPPIFSCALLFGLFSLFFSLLSLSIGHYFAFCTSLWIKLGLFFIDATEGALLLLPFSFLSIVSRKELGYCLFLVLSLLGIFLHLLFQEKSVSSEYQQRE